MNQSSDPDAGARTALRLIGPDPANWVPDRPGIDHNVAIIGGGQTGCALAFALRRAGIGKVTVLEAAPDEERAGIWLNAARMNVLRTPKTLPGPELGVPAFSFQAWYEARHGQEAYAAIDRIKRTDWVGLPGVVQAISRHPSALSNAPGPDRARGRTFHVCTSTRRTGRRRRPRARSSWRPDLPAAAAGPSPTC